MKKSSLLYKIIKGIWDMCYIFFKQKTAYEITR